MNLRKISHFAVLSLVLVLVSCGTTRRATKDLFFTAATPVMMLYGGGTDGFDSAKEVRAGMQSSAGTEVIVMPFTFVGHAIKHLFYGVAHAIDFVVFPVYGAAELHPYGPEVEPLDIYTGTWFDRTESGDSGTDAESGETK